VKRRAEVTFQPWHDAAAASLICPGTLPEEAFDRTWAEALVAQAMAQLEEKWAQRSALFAALRFTVECHHDDGVRGIRRRQLPASSSTRATSSIIGAA